MQGELSFRLKITDRRFQIEDVFAGKRAKLHHTDL